MPFRSDLRSKTAKPHCLKILSRCALALFKRRRRRHNKTNFHTMNFSFSAVKDHFLRSNGGTPPALTAGLAVFLLALYFLNAVVGINAAIALHADSLFKLDMNRLSMYPLGHLSILHVVFNIMGLLTPLSKFERSHGTVYTGVILNLFAVFAAIPYCIFGYFLWPNTSVLGSSGWFFSFITYYAYHESLIKPTIRITPDFNFPTLYTPLVLVVGIAIIMPGSSMMGHFFGCVVGYAYSFKYMDILVPPSKVIEWIENKLERLIGLIPNAFQYYKEVDAKHLRSQSEYVSMFEPITTEHGETATGGFPGEGRTLGTA